MHIIWIIRWLLLLYLLACWVRSVWSSFQSTILIDSYYYPSIFIFIYWVILIIWNISLFLKLYFRIMKFFSINLTQLLVICIINIIFLWYGSIFMIFMILIHQDNYDTFYQAIKTILDFLWELQLIIIVNLLVYFFPLVNFSFLKLWIALMKLMNLTIRLINSKLMLIILWFLC